MPGTDAGSIFHAWLIPVLIEMKVPVKGGVIQQLMEKFLTADGKIKRAPGKPAVTQGPTVIYTVGVPERIKLASRSTSHGGFDNDEATLNSTLRIIAGGNTITREF